MFRIRMYFSILLQIVLQNRPVESKCKAILGSFEFWFGQVESIAGCGQGLIWNGCLSAVRFIPGHGAKP